ncbi:globin family protein [Microbulbifer pacificus]|uniref:Uncharacterized protein n=1 Tax=Microbulbifer pacificus TaxID=407164 RepID=A0AAU0MYS3_9GAMM|nr:hypothetical protein [Microbulbifer pacificus]WOX05356.1 hypothetical protein R5R33_16670 [Microbulbifer pacificus]
MPSAAPTLLPIQTPAPKGPATVTPKEQGCPLGLLARLGGRQFLNQTVAEFYQAIGKYMAPEDAADHDKQHSRQAQFLSHALAGESEPTYSARANFLARGLNPALFEALLEYLEARLLELGFSSAICDQLVRTTSNLLGRGEEPLSIAC